MAAQYKQTFYECKQTKWQKETYKMAKVNKLFLLQSFKCIQSVDPV